VRDFLELRFDKCSGPLRVLLLAPDVGVDVLFEFVGKGATG